MILSNVEIHKALDDGRLRLDPEPQPRKPTINQPNCPYDTTSVDLRLGDVISIPKGGPFTYDLRRGGIAKFLSQHFDHLKLNAVGGYALQPNQFILGRTLERVELPIVSGMAPLAARVEGKSSFARCGLLVHFTAPTVHGGWVGPLTLEMKNLGANPITLYPGMPICQLIVETVLGDPVPNPSQFQGQVTPAGLQPRKQ
jgi:dCTP deaminase